MKHKESHDQKIVPLTMSVTRVIKGKNIQGRELKETDSRRGQGNRNIPYIKCKAKKKKKRTW